MSQLENRPAAVRAIGRRWLALSVTILALAAIALPVAGDLLVLNDGTRIETRGEWEVKGRLVVFELPTGALSSMRLSEVDLEASKAATEAAKEARSAPPPAPKPKRKAVLVLTDDDIPRARPVESDETADGDDSAKAVEGTTDGDVEVSDWDIETPQDRDGTVVRGTVSNNGSVIATQLSIEVLAYDTEGTLLGRVPATVPSRPVAPGRVARFEALFRGVYGIVGAKFVVKSKRFSEQDLTPPAPTGDSR
ncbi:MAG: FxLYD domain-containing protein [Acidobacteriota bacterium]